MSPPSMTPLASRFRRADVVRTTGWSRARTVDHRLLGLATRRVVAETRKQRDAPAAGAGRPDRPAGGGDRGRGVDRAARAGRRSSSSSGPGRSGPPARASVDSGTPPVAAGHGVDQALRRPAPRRRRRRPRRARGHRPRSGPQLRRARRRPGPARARPAARRGPVPGGAPASSARPLRLALGYELDRLPSFVTPAPIDRPTSCSSQGSCRRTNAAGPDAMAYLDDLIAEHRLDLTRRPQQLFLTGDQIYADDLSGCLLPQINAIGRELLGFTETLPDRRPCRPGHDRGVPGAAPPQGGPGDRSLLDQRRPAPPPLLRRAAGDAPAGVEPLGVAPAAPRPTRSSCRPRRSRRTTCRTGRRTTRRSRATRIPTDWRSGGGRTSPGFTEDVKRAEIFRAAVPRVARALANTAHVHDLRRPRDHRRLVPVAVLADPGAHRAVRSGDRPQRLRRLRGVPGLGQRPVGVHPHRPEPRAEERGAARHARLGRDRRRVRHDHDREAGAAARPHEAGDRPRGQVRLHGSRTPPPGARARHPLAAHVSRPARATDAARQQPRRPAPPGPAHRWAGAAGRRLAGARS